MNKRLILLIITGVALGTLVAITAFGALQMSGFNTGATITRVTGKALIGGSFSLVDHKGKKVTEKDFKDGLYCGPAGSLDLLTEEDLKLVPAMARFPFEVESAARNLDPQKITKFAHDLSAAFQRFYTLGKKDSSLRVVTDDTNLTKARLYLVGTLGLVLRSTLNLLGVSTPTSM